MSDTQTQGKSISPDLKKNLLILGAVVGGAFLLFVLILVFRSPPANQQEAASVKVPAAGQLGVPATAPPTENMKALVREKQLQELEEARLKGRMYIPSDTEAAVGLDGRPLKTPGSDIQTPVSLQSNSGGQLTPVAGTSAAPAAGAALVSDEERLRDERMRRGLELQLQSIVDASRPSQAQARIDFGSGQATAGAGGAYSTAPANRAPVPATADKGPRLVDSLEIFAGMTSSPIDTYKTGYVSASIASGALSGAFLIGRTEVANEGLIMRFTNMRFEGRTYKINAIGIDEKTGTDAMDADLDRRYLERYVMPVLMAGAGAYAAARADTGQQVVTSTTGSSVATPAPSSKQAAAAGIAAGVGIAQGAVNIEARKPIRASLPARSMIGVMFIEPVAQSDATTPAAAASDLAVSQGSSGPR